MFHLCCAFRLKIPIHRGTDAFSPFFFYRIAFLIIGNSIPWRQSYALWFFVVDGRELFCTNQYEMNLYGATLIALMLGALLTRARQHLPIANDRNAENGQFTNQLRALANASHKIINRFDLFIECEPNSHHSHHFECRRKTKQNQSSIGDFWTKAMEFDTYHIFFSPNSFSLSRSLGFLIRFLGVVAFLIFRRGWNHFFCPNFLFTKKSKSNFTDYHSFNV